MKAATETAARYPYPLDMPGLSAGPGIRMETATFRRPTSRAARRGHGDRARSRLGRERRRKSGVVVVSGQTLRRRSRETASRPRVVQFSLTEAEFDEVSSADAQVGLARGDFAAEVT